MARGRKPNGEKCENVYVYMKSSTVEMADAIAAKIGMSRVELLRAIIEGAIERGVEMIREGQV